MLIIYIVVFVKIYKYTIGYRIGLRIGYLRVPFDNLIFTWLFTKNKEQYLLKSALTDIYIYMCMFLCVYVCMLVYIMCVCVCESIDCKSIPTFRLPSKHFSLFTGYTPYSYYSVLALFKMNVTCHQHTPLHNTHTRTHRTHTQSLHVHQIKERCKLY